MRARFHSDMSADLEKICDRFTDFPVGADFTAQAYVSLCKMADVESKSARKKRSFDEKEINLLISQWSEFPCLFDKTNPDHKDQNKLDIARQQIAESPNEALDYEKGADKFITVYHSFTFAL